ncbi:hypothetical protein [Fimbriiglobus ruber]|uniref:Heme A synthase, cytochrome oxidase biogenesis protein Cox15-CtaA n=1 Tax=Fimbriiglobus ruber TaxID=1908690 RepID=A0A225DIK5_9BACT|nr:hypothetical protein [Fimbriiglobus ruber]OWK36205.1 Heme A synthase, cytochrome oxidase biogenesis protein Cox15-CtaA [Fimbriiglobus ruber]
MTDSPPLLRPVPRWVRIWAVLTATVALLLLFLLGGFVTSFRVGMADPVWPTEPWYLVDKDWQKLEFGFLVEHTHRAAGWVVGILVSVLAVGAWASEPSKTLRWAGLAAIALLLVAYGEFHRGMSAAETAGRAGQPMDTIPIPIGPGIATATMAGLCLVVAGLAVTGGAFGRWARAMAVVGLIAVMIQGLLGGFRVFLNQLYGTELAAYHGTFAQVVFAVLASVVTLSAPRGVGDSLPDTDRDRLKTLSLVLPAAVFVQLVWGVWLRHVGSPLAQRLHVMTAFVVTGVAVWLVVRSLASPVGRKQLGFLAYHLVGILAVQVMLGVEAWMGKFAAAGPQALVPPMLRQVSPGAAATRTLHVVVGTSLLAAAVVFALHVWRRPLEASLLPQKTED